MFVPEENRNVSLISTMPEIITVYNHTEVGVDAVDEMYGTTRHQEDVNGCGDRYKRENLSMNHK